MAADREPVARDGLAIADTLQEGVAADDVLVLACAEGSGGGARVRVNFPGDEGGAANFAAFASKGHGRRTRVWTRDVPMTVTVTVLDWPESAACVVCASCAMFGASPARLESGGG